MWSAFSFLCLYLFFASSSAWWSYLLPQNPMLVLINFLLILSLHFSSIKTRFNNRTTIILFVILLYSITSAYLIHLSYGLYIFFSYLPALLLYMLPRKKMGELLQFITKWYAVIIGISMCIYGLTIILNVPDIGLFKVPNMTYHPYKNYILFIKITNTADLVYRFNGPFLEPGHQAMISGILLFANRLKFKSNPYLWIILFAIIISFSLAGYIILGIGLILIYIKSISKLIGFAVLILLANYVITDLWNDGDNPVNLLIVDRLSLDEEKGISGNNRTIGNTDNFFNENVKNGRIILGVRNLNEENRFIVGAGYKIFLLRFGLVSAFFVAYLYYLLITPGSNRRYAYSFFFLMFLIFLQRAYPMWFSWLLPYVLGIGSYYTGKHIKQKLKRKRPSLNFSSSI